MSLADIAAADFRAILNADGCVLTLQAPDGRTAALRGNQRDISHAVDPETGQTISARSCSVVVSLADLVVANMAPRGVSDASGKPWVVVFAETVGAIPHTYKVRETLPDRTIGGLVLLLEFYKSAP